jgi:hypothetical protein
MQSHSSTLVPSNFSQLSLHLPFRPWKNKRIIMQRQQKTEDEQSESDRNDRIEEPRSTSDTLKSTHATMAGNVLQDSATIVPDSSTKLAPLKRKAANDEESTPESDKRVCIEDSTASSPEKEQASLQGSDKRRRYKRRGSKCPQMFMVSAERERLLSPDLLPVEDDGDDGVRRLTVEGQNSSTGLNFNFDDSLASIDIAGHSDSEVDNEEDETIGFDAHQRSSK